MFKHIKKIVAIGVMVWGLFDTLVRIYESIIDYGKPDKSDTPEKT